MAVGKYRDAGGAYVILSGTGMDQTSADARYVLTTRSVLAGMGLMGGGALSADITLNVVGDSTLTVGADSVSVASAPKWTTGRTIALTGPVTGTSAAFDGTSNLSFATAIAANNVANAHLAQMAATTLKGNSSGVVANAGDLTVAQTKTMLALDLVTNTSDATKFTNTPLTGTPTAPTAGAGTNTTQLATTAFVLANGGLTQTAADARYQQLTLKGSANGYAPLDAAGIVPLANLPSTLGNEVVVSNTQPSDPAVEHWINPSAAGVTAVEEYMPLSGGTVTGNLAVQGDASVTRLTATLGINAGGNPVNNVSNPLLPNDAATRQWVESRTAPVLVLGAADPVPPGTVSGTVIVRTA